MSTHPTPDVSTITEPAAVRPTPVLDYAALASRISALVIALGAVLVLFGLVTSDQVAQWASVIGLVVVAVGGVLSYVLPLAQARKATQVVTPVDDPRVVDEATGQLVPLVPSTVDLGGS